MIIIIMMVYSSKFVVFIFNPHLPSFTGSLSFIFSIALIQADYLHIVGQCLFGNLAEQLDRYFVRYCVA